MSSTDYNNRETSMVNTSINQSTFGRIGKESHKILYTNSSNTVSMLNPSANVYEPGKVYFPINNIPPVKEIINPENPFVRHFIIQQTHPQFQQSFPGGATIHNHMFPSLPQNTIIGKVEEMNSKIPNQVKVESVPQRLNMGLVPAFYDPYANFIDSFTSTSYPPLPQFAQLPPRVPVVENSTTDKVQLDVKKVVLPEPPKTTSKHSNYLPGGSAFSFYSSYNGKEGDPVFPKTAKLIYTQKEKPEVTIRGKILTNVEDINDESLVRYGFHEKTLWKMYENWDREEKLNTSNNIFRAQNFINSEMFEILIDWMIDVNLSFKNNPETLYLAVHIIRSYLDKVEIRRSRLQLLGITAYFIASKYEEIFPCDVLDMIRITDNAYIKGEVLEHEVEILTELNFAINVPTAHTFLCRYLICDASKKLIQVACYVCERLLQDHKYHKYLPSEIAAVSVYVSREINNITPWNDSLTYYSKYSEEHIASISVLVKATIRDKTNKRNACYKKYSRQVFDNVAALFD